MYNTEAELCAKVEYEGGLDAAIFGYGIHAVDLPRHTPFHIREAWGRVDGVRDDLDLIEKWLSQYEL
jgi:hypothetical protein